MSFLNNKKYLFRFLNIFIFFILCSCYKKQENIHNPFYIKAGNLYSEGNYSEAITFYNKYLKLFPESPKAYYNLATIYLEKKDYIMAIYHFKKYLKLEPDSSDRKIIKKWIAGSEASLYNKLGKEFSPDSGIKTMSVDSKQYRKLKKEVSTLKRQNKLMRDFIIKHQKTLLEKIVTDKKKKTASLKPENGKAEKDKTFSTRQYLVKPGDTLYKISKKMYGSYSYYNLIWSANKDRLRSPSDIRPGITLTLPAVNNN
ncbi:MAG: tetratricopeptide repeat protein [Victivallales bacterium]|nr:tetratricopeptide repeat protein [Victivallales bacterium]